MLHAPTVVAFNHTGRVVITRRESYIIPQKLPFHSIQPRARNAGRVQTRKRGPPCSPVGKPPMKDDRVEIVPYPFCATREGAEAV